MIGQAAKHIGGKRKNAVNIGVCACYLAIIEGYTVEAALDYIETLKRQKHKHRYNSKKDVVDMIIMKEEEDMTYEQIAEIYDIDKSAIFRKIKKVKKKRNTSDMIEMKKAGFTYQEIGDFFGIGPQAVYDRFRNFAEEDIIKEKKNYDREKLLFEMVEYVKKKNKMPKTGEFGDIEQIASYQTYVKFFDGIKDLKKAVREELDNDKVGSPAG